MVPITIKNAVEKTDNLNQKWTFFIIHLYFYSFITNIQFPFLTFIHLLIWKKKRLTRKKERKKERKKGKKPYEINLSGTEETPKHLNRITLVACLLIKTNTHREGLKKETEWKARNCFLLLLSNYYYYYYFYHFLYWIEPRKDISKFDDDDDNADDEERPPVCFQIMSTGSQKH